MTHDRIARPRPFPALLLLGVLLPGPAPAQERIDPGPARRPAQSTEVPRPQGPRAAATPRSPELFPEEDVKPGLLGEVHTVLHGRDQETLEVEVLGVLDDGIAPGVDMIVARLRGDKGNWNGVASGMSGSPVYIGTKLLGALSYSIGQFSKEPILGITPIRQMLALKDYPGGILPWIAGPATSSFTPVPLTLSAPGLAPKTVEGMSDLFAQLNLAPGVTAVPSASAKGPQEVRLEPGDPVSALLIWGDMKVGATGTITWREGNQLLGFGHPFLASGRAEMPIAGGEILWTVPSLMSPFKIAKIGEPVGTLRQDRITAIAGEIGPIPAGLPVNVTVHRENRPSLARKYQIARDPFLTPVLAAMAFRMTVSEGLGAERDETLRLTGTLALADGRQIRFSAGTAPSGLLGTRDQQLGMELMQRVIALVRPPMPLPQLAGVDLVVQSVEPEGAWTVQRVMPDRLVARPGETVRVMVDLSESRGGQRREIFEVAIPQGHRPGAFLLIAGSARSLAGEFGSIGEARRRTARTADEYIAAMAEIAADDRLEVALARASEGLVSEGQAYPALPGSAHILMRSRPGGTELYRARWQPLVQLGRDLDRTVLDVARVGIEILSPESSR